MSITSKSHNQVAIHEYEQDKLKTKITIEQFANSNFYVVKWEKGPTPGRLSGKYTSLASAKEAIAAHLRTIKQSPAARYSKKEENNGASSDAESNSNS